MADGSQDGLEGSKEQSLEEIFSGPLEQPEGDESQSSEQPKVEADSGKSSSEPEDSELGNLYLDLEKDIPEALKTHATNVKKKVQAFLTRKTQTYSEKLKALEANQITEDLKKDYSSLYGWYEKIQKNPKAGLKELASQYGVSVKDLVEASEAQQPNTDELSLEFVKANPTAENWAAFTRQEARKAAEAIRDKEVKPLQETFSKMQASSVQQEHMQRGSEALKDAIDTLPGFTVEVDGKKVLSQEGIQALELASKSGQFFGPNALKNAFNSIIAQSSISQAKEWETKFSELKKSIAGASNPPGGPTPKTTTPPMTGTIEDRWTSLRNTPLSS